MSKKNNKKSKDEDSSSSESSNLPKEAMKYISEEKSDSSSSESSKKKQNSNEKKSKKTNDDDDDPRNTLSEDFGFTKELFLVDYSEAAYAVIGNLKKYDEKLKELGGIKNSKLKNPDRNDIFTGFIFAKNGKNTNKLMKLFEEMKNGTDVIEFNKKTERGGGGKYAKKKQSPQIVIESESVVALYMIPNFKVDDKVQFNLNERKQSVGDFKVTEVKRSPQNRFDGSFDILKLEDDMRNKFEAVLVCGEFRILMLGGSKVERRD